MSTPGRGLVTRRTNRTSAARGTFGPANLPRAGETLLKLQADISKKLHADFLAGKPQTAAPAGADNDALEGLNRGTHPLVALLRLPVPSESEHSADARSYAEHLNVNVRRRLGDLAALNPATVTAGLENVNSLDEYRQQLSHWEQDVRAAAALGFADSGQAAPIADLRHFDIQQLLVWHRQRLIDGFWQSPLDREIPYYQSAAESCLQAAQRVVRPSLVVENQLRDQDQVLSARKSADLAISASSRPSLDQSGGVRLAIQVESKSTRGGFPSGTAAIFIRDRDRRLDELPIDTGITLPLEGDAPSSLETRTEGQANLSSNLVAVAFFRGHEYRSDFVVNRLDGVRVEFEPLDYGPPSITLRGDRPQRASYIFILDCSDSMKNLIPVDEESGKDLERRIDVAKRHLISMLTQLAPTDTRIGVKFVGHRIVYEDNPAKNNPTLIQPEWPKDRFPPGLVPPHDVETIFRLREFDIVDANEVRRLLRLVRHWGQSPLYLALIEAFNEFEPGSDERKGIIAITDGANIQQLLSRDEDYRVPGKTNVEENDVLARPNRVPVHFFDFARTPDERNREFVDIAVKTGGTYHSATSGKDLLAALSKQLDLDGYFVADETGTVLNPLVDGEAVPVRLNSPLRISSEQFQPQDYTVEFRSAHKSVSLEGGEAVELKVERSGNDYDIVSVPFEPSEAVVDLVTSDGRPAGYLFRVQRPSRIGSSARFSVSIQSTRSHFTKRPIEVWLQVNPLLPDGQGDPYVFYDASFQPDQPVPVLSWTAESWPEQANQARIEFWCKYLPTSAQNLPLTRILENPQRYSAFQTLPIDPRVRTVDG